MAIDLARVYPPDGLAIPEMPGDELARVYPEPPALAFVKAEGDAYARHWPDPAGPPGLYYGTFPDPPLASFTYSPPSPGPGQVVTFDASGSEAGYETAPLTSWDWVFNGTDQASGVTVTWTTPATPGDYYAELIVTAADGQTATTYQVISISMRRR